MAIRQARSNIEEYSTFVIEKDVIEPVHTDGYDLWERN